MFLRKWLFLVVLWCIPHPALAEGLIYQLPADGQWVQFKMDGLAMEPDGTAVTMTGTVTISSVGTSEVDGKKCRWIEIAVDAKRSGEPFKDIDKVLIPEEHLVAGHDPAKHVLKYWNMHTMSGDQPRLIEDLNGPGAYLRKLSYILHGPFEGAQELEPVQIETKLGALECKGVMAFERIDEQSGLAMSTTYSIRLHDKAPFGVVSYIAETQVRNGDEFLGTMKMKLTLVDLGDGAKSQMPDAN